MLLSKLTARLVLVPRLGSTWTDSFCVHSWQWLLVCVLVHSWFYLLLVIYALRPRYVISYKTEDLPYFFSSGLVICCLLRWIVTYAIRQLLHWKYWIEIVKLDFDRSLRTSQGSVLHFCFVFERFRVRISEDLFPRLVAMEVCFPLSPDESYGRVLRKFTDASICIFSKSFKTIPNPRADDIIAACDRWRYPHCSGALVARKQNTLYNALDIFCTTYEKFRLRMAVVMKIQVPLALTSRRLVNIYRRFVCESCFLLQGPAIFFDCQNLNVLKIRRILL